MNTFSLIITLIVPIGVIAYIVWDLVSHKYSVLFTEMSYDKNIDEINHESMSNTGTRLSQNEICENTRYVVDNYNDIMFYDKNIDEINHENLSDTGTNEICENTQYIVNNYKNILK